jgi:hypothetical protein
LARRQHRRFGADLPVEVLSGAETHAGRLQDASLNGARLHAEGLAVKPGAQVTLRLQGGLPQPLPDKVGPAVVVWSNRQGAGLYFDREDAGCRASVGTLCAGLQRVWKDAPEAAHPRGCCQAGLLLDPPPPSW